MIKRLFFLILLVAGLSFTFADETPDLRELPKTETSSEVENVYYLVELDSVDIYKKMIELENKDASYGANIEGIVFGGGLVCVGTFFFVIGIYAINETSDSDDGWCEVVSISIPFYLLGIPVLAYNIHKYNVRKEHAIKRDKYQEAFDRYKVRMQQEGWKSVQLTVVPTLNLANASFGANAILSFQLKKMKSAGIGYFNSDFGNFRGEMRFFLIKTS